MPVQDRGHIEMDLSPPYEPHAPMDPSCLCPWVPGRPPRALDLTFSGMITQTQNHIHLPFQSKAAHQTHPLHLGVNRTNLLSQDYQVVQEAHVSQEHRLHRCEEMGTLSRGSTTGSEQSIEKQQRHARRFDLGVVKLDAEARIQKNSLCLGGPLQQRQDIEAIFPCWIVAISINIDEQCPRS